MASGVVGALPAAGDKPQVPEQPQQPQEPQQPQGRGSRKRVRDSNMQGEKQTPANSRTVEQLRCRPAAA